MPPACHRHPTRRPTAFSKATAAAVLEFLQVVTYRVSIFSTTVPSLDGESMEFNELQQHRHDQSGRLPYTLSSSSKLSATLCTLFSPHIVDPSKAVIYTLLKARTSLLCLPGPPYAIHLTLEIRHEAQVPPGFHLQEY